MRRERWSSRTPNELQIQKFFGHSYNVHLLTCRLLVPAFLLTLLICSIGSVSAAETGRLKLIRGVLTTSDERPIVGATVEILDRSGKTVAKSLSDPNGEFEVETDAPPGEYELIVTNSDQLNAERVLLGRTDLNVRLRVSAPPTSVDQARYRISARQLAISPKTRARIAAAQDKFEKGNISEALAELDTAGRLSPACSEAWSMRAFIKLADRDVAGAIKDASHALDLDRTNPEAYLALGSAYNSEKDFDRAETNLRRALALSPDSWHAKLELAKSWYGQKRLVLALRQLDLIRHDFPDVHLVRANILIALGRKREGADEFGTFLRALPSDRRAPQIRQIIAEITQAEPSGSPRTSF